MKSVKILVNTLAICVSLLCAAVVALLLLQQSQARQLADANTLLTRELAHYHAKASTLVERETELSRRVTDLTVKERDLRGHLEQLEQEAKTAAEATPRPYRVRAFLGQEAVGGAWIIPHNVTRDPVSGRFVYEPLLLIDESARDHFTVNHTSVVERTVNTIEIYDDYAAYPYAYYATPGRPGRPGGSNTPPAVPRPHPRSGATMNPGASQPDAQARLFAPPMSIVNSRPQVLGTPATSPVNARMFAP